jgi:hypothetical protein
MPRFLWENGSIVDLNTLIPPNSGLQLTRAVYINDRGEIAAQGNFSNGDIHTFILIPCDENHPDVEGCDYDPVEATSEAPVRPAQRTSVSATSAAKLPATAMMHRPRFLRANRYLRFGALAVK